MAAARDYSLGARANRHFDQVVEPELDMKRMPLRASMRDRVLDTLRSWLAPMGREMVGPPRRAVGRELEEAWPSSEK